MLSSEKNMSNFKSILNRVVLLTGIVILMSCSAEVAVEKVVPIEIPTTAMIQHVEEDFTQSCSECHADITPEIYEDWQSSGHGKMNYGCYICHGDGTVEFYPSGDESGCIACHSEDEGHLTRMDYNGCFDCHDGHTLSPI